MPHRDKGEATVLARCCGFFKGEREEREVFVSGSFAEGARADDMSDGKGGATQQDGARSKGIDGADAPTNRASPRRTRSC